MIRTQIYITPEQHKALKQIYTDTGQKITESIRQSIEVYLNEQRQNDRKN